MKKLNTNENSRKQNETLKQQIENINESINEKIENPNENLRQTINEKIEQVNEIISQKVDRHNEAVKQQIAETNERLDQTNEALLQLREDILTQIKNVEDNNKIRIAVLQQETQEKLEKIQENISGQMEHINNDPGQVKNQVSHNSERIEEIQHKELININN